MKQIELTILKNAEEAVIVCRRNNSDRVSRNEAETQAKILAQYLLSSISCETFDELCRLLAPDSELRHGAKWNQK